MNLSNASSIKDIVGFVIGYINIIIPVLFALALVLFMYSALRYVYKAGESKSSEREALVWGLIALFVLFSIWGILRIVCSTFLGSASCNTSTSQINKPLDIRPSNFR